MPALVAPSILSADFARLGAELDSIASADWVHVDVMDGRFVPNITIGPLVVEAAKRSTKLPLDVHLMIVEPDRYLEDFRKAGADWITVHAEACTHLDRSIQAIHAAGQVRGNVQLAVLGIASLRLAHGRLALGHSRDLESAGR